MDEDRRPIPEGALQWKAPDQRKKAQEEAEQAQVAKSEQDVVAGVEILAQEDMRVETPVIPWMPTNAGDEIRVRTQGEEKLLATDLVGDLKQMASHLAKVGKQAIIAAEVSSAYAVDAPISSDTWHDAPWFNININSHVGGKEFPELTSQIFLRDRAMQSGQEKTSNPYWTLPIPPEYPLSQSDRRPYDEARIDSIRSKVSAKVDQKQPDIEKAENGKLFFDEEMGTSSFEDSYNFDTGPGRVMIWQGDGYQAFTGDKDALVSREDGMHLILISKYEQMANKGEAERFAFFWQDPKRLAEMAIISAAISNAVVAHGLAGEKYDKAYIHANANWSLSHGLRSEERNPDLEFGTIGTETDAQGNPEQRKWPENPKGEKGLNVHPHIQILKEGHDINLPPSGKNAGATASERPALLPEEAAELRALLEREVTPLLRSMSGKSIKELEL